MSWFQNKFHSIPELFYSLFLSMVFPPSTSMGEKRNKANTHVGNVRTQLAILSLKWVQNALKLVVLLH